MPLDLEPSIRYLQNEFPRVLRENIKNLEIQIKTPRELEREFRGTPYHFDPRAPLRTYARVKMDGYAACGEAAAAIGASMAWRDMEFKTCLRTDDLTGSTHVVLIYRQEVFDPYSKHFGGPLACTASIPIFPIQ